MAKNNEKLKGRKAFITFNNPKDHGYNTEKPEDMKPTYFDKALSKWSGIEYMCCTKEIGNETGTEHDHLYIHFHSPVYRTSIQKLFPNADIEFHNASDEDNRNYTFKLGEKYKDDKAETKQNGYQFEYGTLEVFRENQGKRSDFDYLKEMILAGKSNADIYNENASYMEYASLIDRLRLDLIQDKYKKENRFLKVIYQYGETGAGKTRGVMDKYGYDRVYRVTDYDHPFDSYNLQDTIIFEEFRSNIKIELMLN